MTYSGEFASAASAAAFFSVAVGEAAVLRAAAVRIVVEVLPRCAVPAHALKAKAAQTR
jgi:hypothetical protein